MIYSFNPQSKYEVIAALDYYTRSQKGEAKLSVVYDGHYKAHFVIDANPFGKKCFVDLIAGLSNIEVGEKYELTAQHAHRLMAISLDVYSKNLIRYHALHLATAFKNCETHLGVGSAVLDYTDKVLSLDYKNTTLPLCDKMLLVESQRIQKYRLVGKELELIESAFGTVAATAPIYLLELLDRLGHRPTYKGLDEVDLPTEEVDTPLPHEAPF